MSFTLIVQMQKIISDTNLKVHQIHSCWWAAAAGGVWRAAAVTKQVGLRTCWTWEAIRGSYLIMCNFSER
jgi:hypothetical protein